MNDRFKFRAWDGTNMLSCGKDQPYDLEQCIKRNYPILQWTGLKDKSGIEIYEGDILNVFYTSYGGEHSHDCIYQVVHSVGCGFYLNFKKLLWENYGYNQYPLTSSLKLEQNLGVTGGKLFLKDTYTQSIRNSGFHKENDESFFVEIIGNIYENPELLT